MVGYEDGLGDDKRVGNEDGLDDDKRVGNEDGLDDDKSVGKALNSNIGLAEGIYVMLFWTPMFSSSSSSPSPVLGALDTDSSLQTKQDLGHCSSTIRPS
jgi:hypothetical protein